MSTFSDRFTKGEDDPDFDVVLRHKTTGEFYSLDGSAAISSNPVFAGMTVVEHGADADFERPTASAVYWIGSVEPTNGEDVDLWYDTSA